MDFTLHSARRAWMVALFRTYGSAVLVALVVALLCFIRKPGAFTLPQFVAEDAMVFHGAANELGLKSLVTPYAGYLHVLPRITALYAQYWIDPLWQPFFYNYSALVIELLISIYIFYKFQKTIKAAFLVVSIFTVPQLSEVIVSLTNVHWFCAIYIIAMLCCPVSGSSRVFSLEVGLLTLAAFSSPFCMVATVIAVTAFILDWQSKSDSQYLRRRGIMLGVLLTASVIQLYYMQIALATFHIIPVEGGGWPLIFGMRGFAQSFLPQALWPASPLLMSALGWIFLSLPLIAALLPGVPPKRRLLLFLSFFLCIVSTIARKHIERGAFLSPDNGPRYFFLIRVLFSWIIIEHVFATYSRVSQSAVVIYVCSLVGMVCTFREPPLPDLRWREYADKVRAGIAVGIPINPVPMKYPYAGRH